MNKKVGIVACSNAQPIVIKEDLEKLFRVLEENEYSPVFSKCIYEKESCFSGSGKERAAELMKFFEDEAVTDIFDISGGDMANEILEYLDYDKIKESNAKFWGYSDLTTVINAIYTKTGKTSVLYQIKNLIGSCQKEQLERFQNQDSLFNIGYSFVQGNSMEGIVLGGNIRCFLKLAGTEYFPELTDKILLLEARGGEVPQMVTFLSQLRQMGVFKKIKGIILGTFTAMEKNQCDPDMITLIKKYTDVDLPIIKTSDIGHGKDSKAIVIGKNYYFG